MKASELIELLKRKIEDHGDWEVVFSTIDRNRDNQIEKVEDVKLVGFNNFNKLLFLLE